MPPRAIAAAAAVRPDLINAPTLDLPEVQENDGAEAETSLLPAEREEGPTAIKIRLTVGRPDKLFVVLYLLVEQAIYGLPKDMELPQFTLPTFVWDKLKQPAPFTAWPPNVLSRRAALLAHLHTPRGTRELDHALFFRSNWHEGATLFLTPSFRTSLFGTGFGHAIAWDARIKTVCFRRCQCREFGELCHAIVKYAITIEKIAFLNYTRGDQVTFKFDGLPRMPVKKWHFINTASKIICAFLDSSSRFPEPIGELVIARHSYNEDDARRIFRFVRDNDALKRPERVELISVNFREFIKSDFSGLMNSFTCLTTLYISQVNVDGNSLLGAICLRRSCIRKLVLKRLRFANSVEGNLALPVGLVLINVSRSQFVGTGFRDFLLAITRVQHETPFFLIARKLQMTADEYVVLSKVTSWRACKPNIREITFSGNTVFSVGQKGLFGFLETQRLSFVVFDDIVSDNSSDFISALTRLIERNGVSGIELGFRFEPTRMTILLTRLAFIKALKTIILKGTTLGNKGIESLTSALKLLANLEEIACDGFRPEPLPGEANPPILRLWRAIGSEARIKRSDIPIIDLAEAGIKPENLHRQDKKWWDEINGPNRLKVRTQKDRLEAVLAEPFTPPDADSDSGAAGTESD
jgi:hypothetical protein